MLLAVAAGLAVAAALAWAWLLALHGGFWRTDQRLPAGGAPAGGWPSVTAVIPARDEAAVLPLSLPSLLGQDYPGPLAVIVVDDESRDGTGAVAAGLGRAAGWAAAGSPGAPGDRELQVLRGDPPPAGWAGKVWAMAQGAAAAGNADFLLFTDADIAYGPGTVTALAGAAGGRGLVSQMALLRVQTGWERAIVPAFVYFFAQLYPFRRVNRAGGRTAAAAGGCMLVRRDALAAAGGLAPISAARIDDVALGRLLKRAGASLWLGLSTGVTSTRPYDRLADLWNMVARSAYTQLRYSPLALAGTVLGLAWLYLLPPAAALAGAGLLLAGTGGGSGAAAWLAGAGAAGWAMMAASYVPMLRLYRLSPLRGLTLPLIALLYAGMTADSARRHHAGRGGEWKGRTIQDAVAGARPAVRLTPRGPVTAAADGGGERPGLQAGAAAPDLEAGLDVEHPPPRPDQAHPLHPADDRQQGQPAHRGHRPHRADLDVVPVRAVVGGHPVVDVPAAVIDPDDPRADSRVVAGVEPDHQLGAPGLAPDGRAVAAEPDVEGRVPPAGRPGAE